MDRDGHVMLFPANFFAFVVFKLKALVSMFMKKAFVSIKDRILQYAVSFRVVHERINKITEGGLSVNTKDECSALSDGIEL